MPQVRRFVTALSVSALAAATLPFAATAASATTGWPPTGDPTKPWVVSLGDSYISGEGAMEASRGYTSPTPGANTWSNWNTAAPTGNYYSGLIYGDAGGYTDAAAQEAIAYCHRSAFSAITGLADDYQWRNLACSGATATSELVVDKNGVKVNKPGIDFEAKEGVPGQATMLEEFASNHDVEVVVLSIGGNDIGFADIAAACVAAYLVPGGLFACSKGPVPLVGDVSQSASPANLSRVRERIKGAVANVATAMRNAGRPDGSWRLVFQSVPMPIADVSTMAYAQSGSQFGTNWARQNLGGCGILDVDLKWIETQVYSGLMSTMREAVEQSKPALGATPVVFQDNSLAFAGHRLCDKGTIDANVNFPGGVSDPTDQSKPLVDWSPTLGQQTEWVTPIIVGDQESAGGKDKHKAQNALHPNYWGQRALSACLDIALDAGDNSVVKCTPDASGQLDGMGRPAMTLAAPVEALAFTLAPAPKVDGVETDPAGTAEVFFTMPDLTGVEPVDALEYSLDGGANWQVADETSPLVLSGLTPGEPYNVALRLVTASGPGVASPAVPFVIAPGPQPPTDVKLSPLDYAAEVNFTPGDTGGWWDFDRYEYRVLGPAAEVSDWKTIPGGTTPPLTIAGLTPDTVNTIEIRGVTFVAESEPTRAQVTPGPKMAGFYRPVTPVRMYDSRDSEGANETGAFAGTRTIDLSGQIPAGASAMAFNVTVTGGSASGYLAVDPADDFSPPSAAASVINWAPNATLANAHIVKLGDGRRVDLTVGGTGTVHVILDLLGYYTAESRTDSLYVPLADPVRVHDSRADGGKAPLAPGGNVVIDVKGKLADAWRDGATAVALNVTTTGGENSGNLAVFPSDKEPTGAVSFVNWSPQVGRTIANGGQVELSADGKLTVQSPPSSKGDTHFIVDVLGQFGPLAEFNDGAAFFAVTPVRAYDSRTSDDPLAAGPARSTQMSGHGEGIDEVPAGIAAVAVNTTIAQNTATGYLSLTPGGVVSSPNTSTINWSESPISRANGVTMGVEAASEGPDRVKAWVGGAGATHYLLDVAGYYQATDLTAPGAPEDLQASPADGAASISFTPGDDGGLPVLFYEYSLDGGPWQALPKTNESPALILGLVNGTEYSIALRARNDVGPGAASDPVTVTPLGVPTAPVGVQVAPGDRKLLVNFTPAAPEEQVTNYEFTTDAGETWMPIKPASIVPPFVLASASAPGNVPLINGNDYQVQIRGINSSGAGDPSEVVTQTPAGPPSVPQSLSRVPVVSDRTASVSFKPPATVPANAPVLKYQWRTTNSPGSPALPDEPAKDEYYDCADPVTPDPDTGLLTCTLTGLRNGTSYVINVRAVNVAGAGTAASVVGVRSGVAPTLAPTGLNAPVGTDKKSLRLYWSNPTQPTGTATLNNVEFTTDGGATAIKRGNPTGTTTASSFLPWTVTTQSDGAPLAAGTGYQVQVRLISEAGPGPWSSPVSVTMP